MEQLERESKRWEMVDNYEKKLKEREDMGVMNQRLGLKRTANSNGYTVDHADWLTTPSL